LLYLWQGYCRRIADKSATAAKGVAVLRFGFTGLGNSDGDFSNTNFSSNIGDLIRAAVALEKQYSAPQILIGHSLGGAAVLGAAAKIDSVKAVVTIAARRSSLRGEG
jgi:pimeloyl-ACP methyl ester carboxylesterase